MATLVYHLDAGNPSSYSGSGASWYDVSGNSYVVSPTCTLVNSPTYQVSSGVSYIKFTNAGTQYGQFAMSSEGEGTLSGSLANTIYQQSFSMALWVKFDSTPFGGSSGANCQTLCTMRYDSTQNVQFTIACGANGGRVGQNEWVADWLNYPTHYYSSTDGTLGGPGYPLIAGKWYHVVGVWEKTGTSAGVIRLYVNGYQVASLVFSGATAAVFQGNNATQNFLNRSFSPADATYCGDTSINSYRIYQGALSASEVYNLFRASAAPFGYTFMASLSPLPKMQFFSSTGDFLVGGKLYTYAAGTTTPLATYTSQSGAIANTNPIILDSRGEANVWLSSAAYKLKLTTATDVEIWTVDNVGSGDQFGTAQFLSAVSGSDTITATVTSPNFTAYAAGQSFNFVAAGTNTTSSVTLNLNGLGAKSVTKEGTTPLAAGDLLIGQVATVVYDGTRFQLTNAIYLSSPPPIGDVTPNTGAFTTLVAPTVNGDTRFNGNVGMGSAASASYRLYLSAAAGDNGAYLTTPELVPAYFVSTDASATGLSMYYYKDSASPIANDDMVNLRMFGNNSVPALTEYGRIAVTAPNVTNGAEAAQMSLQVSTSSTLTTAVMLDGNSPVGIGVGVGNTNPNGKLHVTDAADRTEATAQLTISGSGYAAAHYLDATAYNIKHSSASRAIRVIAYNNGVELTAGATAWGSLSDEREKDIIEPISNALMKLADIRTVIGKYKTDPEGTRRSFLIAQDIQAVLPEAVSESDGVLSLRYAEVIPLLLAAVKELTTRVAVLEITSGQ